MRIRRRQKSISTYICFLIAGLLCLWYQTYNISTYGDFYQPDMQVHICGNNSDHIELSNFESTNRTTMELFIAVLSAPPHRARRDAIRQTWASTVANYSVVYRFFTDDKDLDPDTKRALVNEQGAENDLEFTPTRGGYWMSHRFLYALFWAFKRYNFTYFMRLDDDYFLCLNHLMNDLRYRDGERFLYWGWMRCRHRMVAMDEGFVIFGVDLLREIIRRNNTLCCHPFGDQMMAMWLYRLETEGYNLTYFADNRRILHYRKSFQPKPNFCSTMLGIHQAYPTEMHEYWDLTSSNWFETKFEFIPRKQYSDYCKFPRGWDWKRLYVFYRHEPKPCWEANATWPALENYTMHRGREEDKPAV